MNNKQIEVWADWHMLKGPVPVGVLTSGVIRGKIDPALRLYPGRQYLSDDRPSFGVFLDSSPDRWGRTLIQRRESMLARAQNRRQRKLLESDFLLGVFDPHRMGGLRFKFKDGPFLDDKREYATPPWSSVRELESISLKLEEDSAFNLCFQYGRSFKKPRVSVNRRRVAFISGL